MILHLHINLDIDVLSMFTCWSARNAAPDIDALGPALDLPLPPLMLEKPLVMCTAKRNSNVDPDVQIGIHLKVGSALFVLLVRS